MNVLKLVGLGGALVAGAAIVVALGQAARAQGRDRAPVDFYTTLAGGTQLGVTVRDVDDADVKRAKLDGRAGAVIENVRTGSPADRAGMKEDDIIISFDGEKVRSARHLSRLVDETPEGREVDALVARNGERLTLKMAPQSRQPGVWTFDELRAARPDRFELTLPEFALRNRDNRFLYMFDGGRGRLGVGVQELTEQLGEYFGTQAGVLVTAVDDGTPAKTAGLKAGDVITRINDNPVRNADDLRRRLAGAQGEIRITIVRDRKEQTLTAKLDDPVESVRPRVIRRVI